MNYDDFISAKFRTLQPAGFDWPRNRLPRKLFGWQKDVAAWALRLGRAALFLDTGLGKTAIELAWASAVVKHTGKPVLFLTPLAVGPQVVREAEKFGVKGVAQNKGDIGTDSPGVVVANYQKLHWFAPSEFGGVVGDESSIVKNYAGKVRNQLLEFLAPIPYRLLATATPAPNDHEELGNHAELLGVCTRTEMLATYFVHDSADTSEWRLKGHAVRDFWRWVASWAVVARRPSDLGYPDDGYNLPPLQTHEHRVQCEATPGRLFAVPEMTLTGQRQARRTTLEDRVAEAARVVATDSTRPWIVWCELNDEADAVTRAIPGAVQVAGSDTDEAKLDRLTGFADGRYRVLVSKCSIAGFGLNWQHCSNMVFVGLSHSYEQYYQAVRRCWRFGQTRPVDVHLITSDLEAAVLANVQDKAGKHGEMFDGMLEHTAAVNREALQGGRAATSHAETLPADASGPGWSLLAGDCVKRTKSILDASVHYSVFSPPFSSLYTYTDSPHDMGNCNGAADFYEHFRYLLPELFRVLMPGRLLSFHCMNLPTTKERHGVIGIEDFRGDLIRLFQGAGFVFHSEVCIWKDPVVAMQRTKALGLLWKQLKKDSCMSRQAIPDYVVTMRKPGQNPEPVSHTAEEFPVEVWQRYASPVWMDIDQTDVLPYAGARAEQDERHICPLQLGVIQRCLELWSNPGDLILSPFAGIGSEGYQSVRMGRRFIGCELKPSYFAQATSNLEAAVKLANEKTLFDVA